MAVQIVPTTDPRIIMGPVPGPDLGLRQLCASDLDIVQPTMVEGEDVDVQSWRVLTFCAEARSNIDSDIVNKVTEAAPRVRLPRRDDLRFNARHGSRHNGNPRSWQ